MKGRVVAADAGSTGDIWATAHRAEHGFADIRRFEGLARPYSASRPAAATATSAASRP